MINTIKKMSALTYFILGIGAIVIAFLYFWTFYPYKPIDIQNAPVPVQPPTQASGSNTTVIATLKACKLMDVVPFVTRTLVGKGVVVMTPTYQGVLDVGCSTLRQAIILPDFLPEGTYHIHWRVTYKVNPIRQVIVNYDSQEFNITKRLDNK